MIELYNSNNKSFDWNGDITLNPNFCTYTVSLNTLFSLEIEHPLDELGRWKYIKEFTVIKAPIPNGKMGLFKIMKINKNINSITAFGIPLPFFTLSKTNLEDTNIRDLDGNSALKKIALGTDVITSSNIVDLNNCNFFKVNKMQAISGNGDNTFLKRWGGEIYPIENTIYVNYKLGGDYGSRIAYGFNMEEIGLLRDFTNVATRIYPYVIKNTNDTLEIPEKYIDSSIITSYSEIYERYIDFSDKIVLKTSENEEGLTEDEAIIKMRELVKELYENGIDKPITTGEVSFIALENTDEYKNFKGLVEIDLGDYVTIEHTDIDIYTKERCVGFIFDCIDKKYTEVTLGNLAKNEFDIQSDAVNRLDNILSDDGGVKSEKLTGIIDAAKTKFKAMRDIAQTQQVRAMLFEDKIKGSKTYGALCLGSMGLEIASKRTPDDKDWDWATFIGGGYAVADWLIGKLRTVLIENMDGSFSIDLNKPGGAIFKNNGKLALEIVNNAMNFYDWYNDGKSIGSLSSVTKIADKNKSLIQLANDWESGISIAYPIENGNFKSYIEFDKFNILNNDKNIVVYTDIDFKGNTFFGDLETFLYNTKSKMLGLNAPVGSLFCTSQNDANSVYFVSQPKLFKAVNMGNGQALVVDNNSLTLFSESGGQSYFKAVQSGIMFGENGTGRYLNSLNTTNFNFLNNLLWGDNTKGLIGLNCSSNCYGSFYVEGNLTVSGTKNRLVKTEHYGNVGQNAFETTECWFSDFGEGTLKNKKAVIRIDPKFLETVNTDIAYKVRVWACENGNVWCSKAKRYKQYFIIEGDIEGLEFEYEIIAKQKGYETVRLQEFTKKNGGNFNELYYKQDNRDK